MRFLGFSGDGRNCAPSQAPQGPQPQPPQYPYPPQLPQAPRQTCDQDPRLCHVDASCIFNRQESRYACVCKAGYSGDGYTNCLREGEFDRKIPIKLFILVKLPIRSFRIVKSLKKFFE